jgi:hypothetical protein
MADVTAFFLSSGTAFWQENIETENNGGAQGAGTWRVMKLRDSLTLAAIVGGLLLMFFMTRLSLPERVKPGSPEYDAYIDHYIAECLQNQAADKGNGVQSTGAPGNGIHALPSESEREAACRVYVLQADRLNPDVRPLKHP